MVDYIPMSDEANAIDPEGRHPTAARVVRGGSWFGNPAAARLSNRSHQPPEFRYFDLGFRVLVEWSGR